MLALMAKLASELSVEDVLGADGIIQQHIPGFQPRASQLAMAKLIEQSISEEQNRVIEASTGIGKSFAYLVPAFLSKRKILISTGTKNLQDQLFNKDVPLINKTIVSGKQLALLKGRSNYCCPHRIDKYRQQRRFQSRQMAVVFDALARWSETTSSGDIAEFSEIPENDSLWFYATSNADNCLGGDCPDFDRCFVTRARRRAQEADVIVINHHMFFSDQSLREDGFGELLPDVDVLIFDEAHQLPDIASNFYGRSLTMRQYDMLLRDIVDAQVNEAPDSKQVQELCAGSQKTLADFRLALGRFNNKGEWKHIQHAPPVQSALQQLEQAMQDLNEGLENIKSRGKELASCASRLNLLQQTLVEFLDPPTTRVNWYEWNERSFRLMVSPVDISAQFRQQLDSNPYQCVIFTSATLSSNHSYDYFTRRLGLDDIACSSFDSPFDYPSQAMLYLPQQIPEPSDQNFVHSFVEQCCQLINATAGNAFILFTSYRMLSLVAGMLRKRLKNKLFVQGEQQRSELLRDYLQTPHAVLLGTSSFWEGVDVKGDKLKLVIIDKLPFRSPGDPVYKRRLQYVAEQGGNAFNDVQVPEATISLRQGVGRLIRDIHDRGIVMIADSRLQNKGYGQSMLQSLPDMQISKELDEALSFAAQLQPGR